MIGSDVDRVFRALAARLQVRGEAAAIVVLGGASLVVRELTGRATEDVDVLGVRLPDGTVRSAHPLPPFLRRAALEVGAALDLDPQWLEDRPGSDFMNAAPDGFDQRFELVQYGPLSVWHLAAADTLTIKLVASAERWGERPNKHWDDVRALDASMSSFELARAFAARVWSDESAAWAYLNAMEELLRGE